MGDDDFDRAYGLVLLDSDDNQHVLFPMRDEEGNGPGVLDVERMNG